MISKETKLKFLSLYVRGIRSNFKRNKVFNWLEDSKADVIFLQETYSSDDITNLWSSQGKGDIVFSQGSPHSCGVTILFKANLNYNILWKRISDEGRFILLHCNIDDNDYILLNIYAPTAGNHADQKLFFKQVNEVLLSVNDIRTLPIVIGGDFKFFNTLLNRDLDRMGGNPHMHRDISDLIKELQSNLDLVDIWRLRNPLTRRYSWRQLHPLIQSRLDIWLISDTLQDYIQKTDIIPGVGPDHSAIIFVIEFSQRERPFAINWKLNNSLREDEQYCTKMTENLDNWRTESLQFEDIRMRWEFLKYNIHLFSRK